MFVVAPFSGWLSDLIGTRMPATLGLGLLAGGMWSLSLLNTPISDFEIIWRLILVGVGMGVFSSPNSSAILSSVRRSEVGLVSGIAALMRTSGMTFGIALAVTLFTFFRDQAAAKGIGASADLFLAGLRPAFRAGALLAVVTMFISYTRGRKSPES